MRIGIIGSGIVAQTIGTKLLEAGNDVMISSRNLNKEKDMGDRGKLPSANQWKENHLKLRHNASAGSFAEAAGFGEVLFNCTSGSASIDALSSAGKDNLNGKILVDVANPLDFSKGMPATLTVCNTTSLAEQIQQKFPGAKVVKALNTVNAGVMVKPKLVPDTDLFIAGNDNDAKTWTKDILLKKWFGWKNVTDLGDITAARALEMYLPLWLRLWGAMQTPNINIKVVRNS